MVDNNYIPARGDVIFINCSPQVGKEQANIRPALVLSQRTYSESTGMVIICPITSTKNLHPIQIEIPNGHNTQGVILADQIKSFDFKGRNGRFHDRLPDRFVKEVIAVLSKVIGFTLA